MKKLVVFTGAGISQESGIRTFRDMGGLWEEYDIMEVATPEGYAKNPDVVQKFYNDRRKQIHECEPNRAHFLLVELEKYFNVEIITQNIDNLHERAGSRKVLHLHGEIMKSQSSRFPNLVYDIEGWEIKKDDLCEKGFPLRPHVVWFGEQVPAMEPAIEITTRASIFVVIGSSLNVYPAAGLLDFVRDDVPIYLIDPDNLSVSRSSRVKFFKAKATDGVGRLFKDLTGVESPI